MARSADAANGRTAFRLPGHLGDLNARLPRPGSTACWFQLDRGQMNRNLGILAYGSLIDEPGDEIAGATAEILREGITTPFPVEFARSSRTRAGAPTLVPVTVGGTRIPARIYILHGNVSEEEARDMLWRRETGRRGRRPNSAAHSNPGPNEVIIKSVADFQGVGTVLYTSIAANIVQLTPKQLAALALNSARSAEVAAKGRDGISYLMAALRNGVRTELSAAYEEEVLRQAGAATLADAIERVRFVGRVAAD